jgi:homocysteine S-methyltransferase
VGPYGAALHNGSEYRGEYVDTVSEEEMAAWHEPRIRALQRAGVDLLAIETLPALEEARAVLHLLATKFPGLKAWVVFSCKVQIHRDHEHFHVPISCVK